MKYLHTFIILLGYLTWVVHRNNPSVLVMFCFALCYGWTIGAALYHTFACDNLIDKTIDETCKIMFERIEELKRKDNIK